ncbi:MAG: M3 family peptidase [Rhodobacterales bacterium]|nr:M3 family peptidase [Rhodobacterales bacterium]
MRIAVAVLASLLLIQSAFAADPTSPETSLSTDSPLLAPWTGPYGGLPAFDKVNSDHFEPALLTAMGTLLDEIDAITQTKGKATFENTIEAYENSGRQLGRVQSVYGVHLSTLSTPELRALQQRMAPKQAELRDQIIQNPELFARIEAVYNGKKFDKLDPVQQRLTWRAYNRFVRAGASLDDDAKTRLSEINQELASVYTTFGQNLMADEETWIVLTSEEELGGLSDSLVGNMAADAAAKGLEGQWIVSNTRSSVDPFLTQSTQRALREKVWRAFINRGDNGDAHDNNANITVILALRAERAQLLGYATHAHWRLEDAMAKTPENAMALLEAVWTPAVARVVEEVADQQALANSEEADITIAPWDYRFYQEKVRKARYDVDQDEIKPYMQLEKLREGMFWVAGELYNLQFALVDDVPVAHPDIRVWEVTNADDSHVGLWFFDPYARTGKRSGAWMNSYRSQERFRGNTTTIVSNNSNFVKGAEGTVVLISSDDARTLFHEFGHALHGLLSSVTYPSQSGTNVARDYVEFPSQLNEHWLLTPEVLSKFAVHVETGEAIPNELVEKIQAASKFNQGFQTVEYLSSALMDMKMHLAGSTPIDADAFERDTLTTLGMPSELVMRHRTPQFAHVFSGDGYSAGYYSYLWADTLTADAAEAFHETGSMYDDTVAQALRQYVLSVGDTVDPAEAFRAFRGRDVQIDALMRDRGFPVPE